MVRINLIEPWRLADQHLIAEYNEIFMMLGQFKKHPKIKEVIPFFRLGKGHINFFKNKMGYVYDRIRYLRKEIDTRNFKNKTLFTISHIFYDCLGYDRETREKYFEIDWTPTEDDKQLIRDRITEKLRMKPGWYRYYGEVRSTDFLIDLLYKEG